MAARAELASAGGIFDFYFYLCLLIFNALIGNHDAHGKNFALLYKGRSPVLASFYDLLSTAIYPQLTPKMAMKIGSKYKFSELQAAPSHGFAGNAMVEQIVQLIEQRCALTLRRLLEHA